MEVTNSILLTVKKMLGIAEEYHAFDLDVIVNINSVFLNLYQLGVGPDDPYRITGEEETWQSFLGDTHLDFPGVETYVYLKTRLLFDPPTNSFLVDSMQRQISELEWRLMEQKKYLYPPEEDLFPDPGDDTEKPDDPFGPEDPDEHNNDHRTLSFRSAVDQHPISAISGLQEALDDIPDVQPIPNNVLDEVLQ